MRAGRLMSTLDAQGQNVGKSAIGRYLAALKAVEAGASSNLPFDVQDKSMGFSGKKLLASLQRLTGEACSSGECYVEVGTYRGLTLLSVASANPTVACYGIDNFSHHDQDGINESLIRERAAKAGIHNATLIKSDFEDALGGLSDYIGSKQIGCYLVDGPHDYRSQFVCLTLAHKWLAPRAVIFVDDSNYEHVRQANKDFLLAFPKFKLLFEAYGLAHPDNLDAETHKKVREEYWNGLNIMVHDPDDELEAIYPPTSSDRTRYVNDHLVHSSPIAEAAPEALNFAVSLFRPWRIPRTGLKLLEKMRRPELRNRYRSVNTYSQVGLRYGIPKNFATR
jgi:hypothetical protein